MFQFQSLIANSLNLAGKLTDSTSRSRGRPSLNTSLAEPAIKRRLHAVLLPSDDIYFRHCKSLTCFKKCKDVVGRVK